jgi:hypothetical protein
MKQAKMKILQGMINQPTAEAVTPIGNLAGLKNTEMKSMKSATDVPLSTGRGIKESLTKKIKPKGI